MMELKPCPFCGGELIRNETDNSWEHPTNECILATIDTTFGTAIVFSGDVEAWNRRAT